MDCFASCYNEPFNPVLDLDVFGSERFQQQLDWGWGGVGDLLKGGSKTGQDSQKATVLDRWRGTL